MEDEKMKEHREENEKRLESGWDGPGIEVWPEEDDYVMWRLKRMIMSCGAPCVRMQEDT
jgi:hypothetical protein